MFANKAGCLNCRSGDTWLALAFAPSRTPGSLNRERQLLPDSIEKLHLEHLKRSLILGDQAGLIAFIAMGHAMHLGHAMRTASESSAVSFVI